MAPAGRKLTPPLGSQRLAGAAGRSGRQARILVVDDDEWVSGTLVKRLRQTSTCAGRQDGARAVAADAGAPGFDLVFCDLVMRA